MLLCQQTFVDTCLQRQDVPRTHRAAVPRSLNTQGSLRRSVLTRKPSEASSSTSSYRPLSTQEARDSHVVLCSRVGHSQTTTVHFRLFCLVQECRTSRGDPLCGNSSLSQHTHTHTHMYTHFHTFFPFFKHTCTPCTHMHGLHVRCGFLIGSGVSNWLLDL